MGQRPVAVRPLLDHMDRLCVERKVKGGKLFRLKGVARNGKLVSIELTGDFFLCPEDSISALENILLEQSEGKSIADAELGIRRAMQAKGMEVAGFEPSDLADALMELVRCAGE